MAKRGRPRIHPPKIPNGEDPQITIGNQANQIKLLVTRIETLARERDDAVSRVGKLEDDVSNLQDEIINTQLTLEGQTDAYQRMKGWNDCAREIITILAQGKT